MPARPVTRIYEDPLDVIWLACVKQIGFRLERDDEVFASWDGCNCLRLGRESLDDDDCLAQLVLHELCHGIVEGPLAWNLPDWGLNSFPKKSREHEFAALRLQAALADHVGLRNFFSATTDFFEYYRVIPTEPLHHSITAGLPATKTRDFRLLRPVTEAEDQQAIRLAQQGYQRWETSDWKKPMLKALELTGKVFELVSSLAPRNSLWK